MAVLIAQFVLLISFVGIGMILFRKIPVLIELSETFGKPEAENFILKLKRKIKNTSALTSFSFEVFLQKILSRIKILSLRVENRSDTLLQRLRKNSQKKKLEKTDSYWEKLKKPSVNSLRSLSKKKTPRTRVKKNKNY